MKRLLKLTVSLLSVISLMGAAAASVTAAPEQRSETVITMQTENPVMQVNGIAVSIDSSGTSPVIRDGRTLMPVRAFAESIGANVVWNGSQRTVLITYNGKRTQLTIDSELAYVDYEAKTLDVPPAIINDRTFLPIRFVAESFGCDVEWNGDTSTITIRLNKENVQHAAVIYEADSQTVQRAAEIVADLLGDDLYSADDTDFEPDDYDTVLVGYSDGLQEGIEEVLENGGFSDKHIAPFCVGGIGESEREISLLAAGAYVEDGLEIKTADLENEADVLSAAAAWLSHIRLIQP